MRTSFTILFYPWVTKNYTIPQIYALSHDMQCTNWFPSQLSYSHHLVWWWGKERERAAGPRSFQKLRFESGSSQSRSISWITTTPSWHSISTANPWQDFIREVSQSQSHEHTYLGGDGSTELADEGELMLLCVPLHDGAACPHLCHDAACAPEINGWSVVSLA